MVGGQPHNGYLIACLGILGSVSVVFALRRRVFLRREKAQWAGPFFVICHFGPSGPAASWQKNALIEHGFVVWMSPAIREIGIVMLRKVVFPWHIENFGSEN